jgi:hypothetical protein
MVRSDLGTPAGQMSWSKALACRGADPGVALAAEQWMAAGEIRVTGGGQPDICAAIPLNPSRQ